MGESEASWLPAWRAASRKALRASLLRADTYSDANAFAICAACVGLGSRTLTFTMLVVPSSDVVTFESSASWLSCRCSFCRTASAIGTVVMRDTSVFRSRSGSEDCCDVPGLRSSVTWLFGFTTSFAVASYCFCALSETSRLASTATTGTSAITCQRRRTTFM